MTERGKLLFVIADIHGEAKKLRRLLYQCMLFAHRVKKASSFGFLGDYIDRGPDSADVLRIVRGLVLGGHAWALKGNHEDMFEAASKSPETLDEWLKHGGKETARSFHAAVPPIRDDEMDWMCSLPLYRDDGQRFFVHGAIDMGKPLDQQNEAMLLWGRPRSDYPGLTRLVVHGHTPVKDGKPYLRGNRLNLDTGACFAEKRKLFAAVFAEPRDPIWFISSEGEKSDG